MTDIPPTPDPPQPQAMQFSLAGPPGTGWIMAPMVPIPGVPQRLIWEEGVLPDGSKVAIVYVLSGASTTKIEMGEEMAEQVITGLRGIFNKKTLAIARDMPSSPNGQSPLQP